MMARLTSTFQGNGIALAGVWLVLAAGCAARETFLTPKDLSSELQADPIDRPLPAAEDNENDAASPRTSVQLVSGHDDTAAEPYRLPTQSPQRFVIVSGEVRKPGELAFPEGRDFRVLEAIARAEGIPNKVLDTVVVCRRQKGHDERALIRVSLRKATRQESENIRLMPDDIVSVEPTPTTLMKDSSGYVGAAAAGGGMLLIGGGPH